MMDMALDALSWISIMAGVFFMLVGTLGVLRMPDVYTRLHAAGMTDTMGAGFLILGYFRPLRPSLMVSPPGGSFFFGWC